MSNKLLKEFPVLTDEKLAAEVAVAIRAALHLKRSVAPFVDFSVMSGKPQGAADWMSLVRIAVMQEVGFLGAFQW